MKILFLTDNYPPEVNAPATRTAYHCREWVKQGAEVTVVTCVPNFPQGKVFEGYTHRLYQTEVLEGVRVVRVWSFIAPNQGFAKRVIDYLSFSLTSTLASLREEFDVVVATSPQFFTALAGSVVGRLKGRPWVFELRDLWPESIVATGAMPPGFAIDALERLELDLYRSADLIVSVTRSFKRQLVDRGIAESKIRVVTNGVDAAAFDGGSPEQGLPKAGRPFRVGYLGTHGLAHGLDVAIDAARLFHPDEVEFVLVGDGADKGRLVDKVAQERVENVRFMSPIPREEIPATLSSFDAALVPLRDSPTFRSVIPSKIFEAAAARRPILLGVRGESQELVAEYGAGLAFAPEDECELARSIRLLREDSAEYRRAQDGCARLAEAYSREALARDMLEALMELTPNLPSSHLTKVAGPFPVVQSPMDPANV